MRIVFICFLFSYQFNANIEENSSTESKLNVVRATIGMGHGLPIDIG